MKNKFKLFGLAVLVTAIVFSFAACKNDTTPTPTTDPALNGIWESEYTEDVDYGGTTYTNKKVRWKISNGSIEYSYADVGNAFKYSFTTEPIGTMKMTLTHAWSKSLVNSLGPEWYSKEKLKTPAGLAALTTYFSAYGGGTATAEVVDDIFENKSVTYNYSISGDRLTVTMEGGSPDYFNRIP